MLRDNPYAEWYANTMRVAGSPTQRHHRATYADAPYDDFVPAFNAASAQADLSALAGLCAQSGAGYVVLTTKHHEGFTLWPTALPHPVKGHYQASRDLVGDLTEAVRARGLRMGLYYSGGYDWPYNGAVLRRPADALLAVPTSAGYRDYASTHLRELIDRYRPSVLWNDIGWPAGGNLAELFAHYYNSVEDGVINDRWVESTLPRNRVSDALIGAVGDLVQALWRFIPDTRKQLVFAGARHYDFRTPEYAEFDHIVTKKWESTRGVGHSFGANRNERPGDIITADALIRLLCDVVSKNGNLLIGVGPMPDGSIPNEQAAPLRGLGQWMAVNRAAIVGTRPWTVATGRTSAGTEVRFTCRGERVYAHLLGRPDTATFSLVGVDAEQVTQVGLLGLADPLAWSCTEGVLSVTLPAGLPESSVHVLELGPGLRAQLAQVA
jgi:alpha-L-fucosidase